MIALLYRIFIGVFPCRHRWEAVKNIEVEKQFLEHHISGTYTRTIKHNRIICKCSKCGEFTTFDTDQ